MVQTWREGSGKEVRQRVGFVLKLERFSQNRSCGSLLKHHERAHTCPPAPVSLPLVKGGAQKYAFTTPIVL